MKLLTNEYQESYEKGKIYICGKKFEDKYANGKKIWQSQRSLQYAGEYKDAGPSIRSLKYSIPKEITLIFHSKLNLIIIIS